MLYGVKIEKSEGGYRLACRDFPGLSSEFPTEEEAKSAVGVFVSTCLMVGYRNKRLPIPLPSPLQEGDVIAVVPAKVQAKIVFWNFLHSEGLTMAEAARRLGVPQTEVARMVNMSTDKASISKIEKAMETLGGYFDMSWSKA